MRTKLTKIALSATLVLAISLTLSCSSSDYGGDDKDSLSSSSGTGISSSGGSSSSSTGTNSSSSSDVSSSSGGSSSSGTVAGGSSSSSIADFSDKGNDIANYGTVVIGGQTWMAENLNHNVEGSKCYGNDPSNCQKYGRLYDWSTAMALPSSCNSTICSSQVSAKHRGICPIGWHIPTNADWDKLYRYADGTNGTSSPYSSPAAGKHLKATSGWSNCGPSGSGNGYLCLDTHGFSALPGGGGNSGGNFFDVGGYGSWWSASEYISYSAYLLLMYYYLEGAGYSSNGKSDFFSVRCLQD